MKKLSILILLISAVTALNFSFKSASNTNAYSQLYTAKLNLLQTEFTKLKSIRLDTNAASISAFTAQLQQTRLAMKQADIWLRYLDPIAQKKINGPLPIEWETEVFEKYEAPYKREGTGLLLTYQQTEENPINIPEISRLINEGSNAVQAYYHDTITVHLKSYHHFFLCNRLFLLNLATIYTTGFECPNIAEIIPELAYMVKGVAQIYEAYNQQFTEQPLPESYLTHYNQLVQFIDNQPNDFTQFNHFEFIRDYVNPLFGANQQLIREYKVVSKNLLDYSLSKKATTIFAKNLYFAQNPKGIFNRVDDEHVLSELYEVGKLLFYDPILSQNNERSCASCHKPEQFFTDTTVKSAEQFNHTAKLDRNTPTLLNVAYNHLLMMDGKEYTLTHQTKAVISNPNEMNCDLNVMVQKVLSCKSYKKVFTKLLQYTPEEKNITPNHIVAAITYYYAQFSTTNQAPFDLAMNKQAELKQQQIAGYNLFMSKAQCATCHFAPQFNGIKPPYVNSEFEVLGVPEDTAYTQLSNDLGRYTANPATETKHAFRTGTLRNSMRTAPYMHNGVFKTMDEVIEFYNTGGGAAHGLEVPNQTLATEKLELTEQEKLQLKAFLNSLTENYVCDSPPINLPISNQIELNHRVVGGLY